MRRLPGSPRPAGLAQVQRVEGEAAGREEVRQLRLEEIVRVSVDVQDRAVDGLARPGRAPHQDGGDLALTVRVPAKLEHLLLVTLEGVGLPVECGRHAGGPPFLPLHNSFPRQKPVSPADI
jgi:hypothetical protein